MVSVLVNSSICKQMPEVLNRPTRERHIKAALKKCRDSQRRELLSILGDPPDFNNIPDEFWDKAEECERKSLVPFLVPIFILQSKKAQRALGLDIDVTAIGLDADKLIGRRVKSFARKAVGHTRKRVKKRLSTKERRRLFIPEDIDGIFGDGRIEGAAATEVTEASSQADKNATKGTGMKEGIDFIRLWRLNPACKHCVFCPKVDRTDFNFWGIFVSLGPPAHPRCCCWLDLIPMSREQALRERIIKAQFPAGSVVSKAAREVGIS